MTHLLMCDAKLLATLDPKMPCVVAGVRGGDDHTLSALKAKGIGLGSVLTTQDIAALPTAWLDQLWVHPEHKTEEHG